ncbi:GNAT family N-acetyltransferase [Pantoea ananatis]|uniref:GNAT family N-acetyltransferase n=1 Tax=Pantoea ananas TaxID=553 RepID=UPI000B5F08CA|nr:GNAT family N-acetyltransferase [Pantoea ananatis]ASN16628.1 GNAT family N-acetyltransferase [Pantoea ananatis]
MSDNKFVIEEATISDIDSLIMLRSELLDNSDGIYGCKNELDQKKWKFAYKSWLEKKIEHDGRVAILIAKDSLSGNAVGCITGVIDSRAPTIDCINGFSGWVQSMVVKKEMRNKGIAISLLEVLLKWFNEAEVKKISLQSTVVAESLYNKFGFQQYNEKSYYLIYD